MKFGLQKEGKGVSKSEEQKTGFVLYLAAYLSRFWKLMGLCLLYLAACVPVITIGPATAALMYIVKKYMQQDMAFIWQDFWRNFKSNFKQALPVGIISLLASALLLVATFFYYAQGELMAMTYLLAAVTALAFIILIPMTYYSYLVMVSVELPLKDVLKNAAALTFAKLSRSFVVFLITLGFILLTLYFYPISLVLVAIILPALHAYIVCCILYPVMHHLMIKPLQKKHETNVKAIFTDRTQ